MLKINLKHKKEIEYELYQFCHRNKIGLDIMNNTFLDLESKIVLIVLDWNNINIKELTMLPN